MADDPLAVYPVRTTPGYWLVVVAMALLLGAGAAAMLLLVLTSDADLKGWYALLVLAVALAPVGYWYASSAYRIGGGRSAIRFFADRIELPPARRGPMIVFPRKELLVSSREMRVRYVVAGISAASVRRGYLVRFAAGKARRALSTLTVEMPGAFLDDLKLYQDGYPPIGPERWKEAAGK